MGGGVTGKTQKQGSNGTLTMRGAHTQQSITSYPFPLMKGVPPPVTRRMCEQLSEFEMGEKGGEEVGGGV